MFRRRLLAAIIDAIILAVPFVAITANAVNLGNNSVVFYLALIYPFIQIAYSVLCHYRYGQTLGKSIMKIKVCDVSDEGRISFRQAVYRDSVWLAMEIIGLCAYLLLTYHVLADSVFLQNLSYYAQNFVLYWMVLEIATMMTNKKRRAIHDFLAHTVVIPVEE